MLILCERRVLYCCCSCACIIVILSLGIVNVNCFGLKVGSGNVIDHDRIMLYNTLTKQKEKFVAINAPHVSFYSCGPTVYDFAHIGNFRAFLTYDIVKRWLAYCGYDVNHVCNLTDIDDKIINKMMLEKKTLKEITSKYSKAFFDDLDVLNICRANQYPKATEYVNDIEAMISTLVTKEHAYVKNNSVYFRVNTSKDYGKIANYIPEEMVEGAGGFGPNDRRGQDEKESSNDFALWKAFTPNDGEVTWDSSFGKGRPGWHIECSAMCNSILGSTIDIHAGGIDLVFPHHANEIAQSEAYSSKKFCNYWIHNGFVNINNEKMSKSLKNFKTLRDIATTPFDARAFRLMVVSSQYRSPLGFNEDTIKSSGSSLKRIDKVVKALQCDSNSIGNGIDSSVDKIKGDVDSAIVAFEASMCDDMNTPRAVAALFSLVNLGEKYMKQPLDGINSEGKSYILKGIHTMDKVLGILYDAPASYFQSVTTCSGATAGATDGATDGNIPVEVTELAQKRSLLKASKLYAEADAVRQQMIDTYGYTVKDRKDGFDIIKM